MQTKRKEGNEGSQGRSGKERDRDWQAIPLDITIVELLPRAADEKIEARNHQRPQDRRGGEGMGGARRKKPCA